jgi:hypothetical protein
LLVEINVTEDDIAVSNKLCTRKNYDGREHVVFMNERNPVALAMSRILKIPKVHVNSYGQVNMPRMPDEGGGHYEAFSLPTFVIVKLYVAINGHTMQPVTFYVHNQDLPEPYRNL